MSESTTPPTVAFNDVLAAMGEVDRQRTRDEILAGESSIGSRKREVAERIRVAYTAQGVSVSDAAIEAGVTAYFAERLALIPTKNALTRVLVNAWVHRLSLTSAAVAIVALVIFAGILKERHLAEVERAANELSRENAALALEEAQLAAACIARLRQTETTVVQQLQRAKSATPELASAYDKGESQAHQLASVAIISCSAPDKDLNVETRRSKLGGLRTVTDETVAAMVRLPESLGAFAGKIEAFNAALTTAAALSMDPLANKEIAQDRILAPAAIQSADARQLAQLTSDLKQLSARLREAYDLRIVNRTGEYTRIWFHSPRNPAIKQYYVVVEALGADGHTISQRIHDENDGIDRVVPAWAERVDESFYEQIGAEKSAGKIVSPVFGAKEAGHLNPSYRLGPKASHQLPDDAGRVSNWPRPN